ncbi:MAG: hypothetical protein JXA74_02235, partial [Anaerolineae bacterium]|nr:hypothetical protein [Anaerolineae bacterium]
MTDNPNRSSGSSDSEKPTIRAQRRRRPGATPAAGRQRAQAPRRQGRTDQAEGRVAPTQPRPPSQAASGQGWRVPSALGGAGAAPSRRIILILGVLALLFICIVGSMLLRGGGEDDLGLAPSGQDEMLAPTAAAAALPTQQALTRPTATAPTPVPTSRPFVASAGSTEGQSWLVMLYQDADDKILEKDIYVDLNEAERVGSSENVHIVAQVDRYVGGYSGDGDWTATRRYYVIQDDDLNRVGSQLVADLGEVNMADGATLVDFVTWAVETFPADRVALILSDHGMGWPGGWSDPAPATGRDASTPLSSALGNQLYLDELDAALATIRQRAGIDRFELIGLDACLMGQLEVYNMLANHARYAVASEETEPALGWAYAGFLSTLVANPSMSGAELSALIVDSYIREDQRIVDDEARADLLRQGSPMGGLFGFQAPSSAEVASQMGRNVTLSAVDLSAVPALMGSLNDLCARLQEADQRPAAQARSYARSFTNIFGQQVPPAYLDLGHFLQLLQQAQVEPAVNQAASSALSALDAAVVAEKHGSSRSGATGVAIYFPNSQLFRTPATGPTSYTAVASRFAADSLWDDYLAYHYTGRAFDATARQAAVPDSGATVSAPGRGTMQLSAVELSDTVAMPGFPVLLSTDISAENLGHVLFFAGYYDPDANSLYVADMDYMESADTREVDGVYYPV